MGFIKTVTGIQGIQDFGKSRKIRKQSARKYERYKQFFNQIRNQTNHNLECYGRIKIGVMNRTLVPFAQYLKAINQKALIQNPEVLSGIDYHLDDIMEINVIADGIKGLIGGAFTVGSLSYVAMTGVPALVTGAITTFGVASTGTAISTLSGAAASNAVLAFLGGGSLAVGGGGIAAGSAILSDIAITAGWGVGLAAAGLVTTLAGKRSLNKAEEYKTDVEEACIQMQLGVDFLNALSQTAAEQCDVMRKLEKRIKKAFKYFRPILVNFDINDAYHVEVFRKNMILCKTLSDIAQTPLVDDTGDLSKLIVEKIQLGREIAGRKY